MGITKMMMEKEELRNDRQYKHDPHVNVIHLPENITMRAIVLYNE